MDIRDYTDKQMRFLDAVKIAKLPDSNCVVVSFFDLDGRIVPSVTIGRKQLVTLYEKIARDFPVTEFPAIHARAVSMGAATIYGPSRYE